MPTRLPLAAPLVLAAALASSTAARADAIDGDWCSADGARMMSIRGPAIVTPGGRRTEGDYARHFFSYQVPAGEPGAGHTVSMQLLNEDTVRLDAGPAGAQAPAEIWHRCRLPTS